MTKEAPTVSRKKFILASMATALGVITVGFDLAKRDQSRPNPAQAFESQSSRSVDNSLTKKERNIFFQETEGGSSYLVQREDTLFNIAQIFFDDSLDTLLELNPNYQNNPSLIHAGDIVKLPPELIVGNISLWQKKPSRNNQWIRPGKADYPMEWKDVVICDHQTNSCGTEHFPYTVVTLYRFTD